jgi:WD repeat-containing protein 23
VPVQSDAQLQIWSVRFSADAREIVAGANQGLIFVYDIDSQRPILRLDAHNDDVNAVCFADTASSNVLVSGSDDGLLKVWDRRSLQGQTPSGVLVGHTEGLTFVAAKGDGRYVVSNGKDQTAKLWDLRMMYSAEVSPVFAPA